jgi:hypothetical protein
MGSAHGVRIARDALRPTVFPFGHQLGSFEHGDVLLHGSERHVVARSELADRRVGRHDSSQDVASSGIGQRAEQLVENFCRWLTCNHMVVYLSTRISPAMLN